MNKNTKRVLSAITIASLAVVPDGVAPTVAPSAFNLNGGVVHAAEENIVSVAYHFEGDDNTTVTRVKVNIAENPNATVGDYYPLSKNGGNLKFITKGKGMMWVYKVDPDHNYRVDHRGDLLSKYAHLHLLGEYTQPNNASTEVKPNNDGNANAGANNNASTEVKPNNDGNANAGANNNEKPHKVTINYDLYDDPMLPFSSSSSSKVFDVTPNQPLSDHIPKTLPGGYVFAGGSANSGGSEGSSLEYNDPFGNWTNFHVTYVLKPKKSRTNLSNAGTNNNEKPHKVTIYYYPYENYPGKLTEKVVYVTPNQPLSDHFPETLPGGYVFATARAIAGGSEGGVLLSSRNDLFGNETTFYARYLPESMMSRTNPSNAGTNNNAGTETKPNNGNTNAGTNNNAGTEVKPNNGNTNAGTNNNAGTEVKPNNGNTNAGTNNNAGTEVKPGNNDNTGNNKPENKPAPENKPNNNSNAENTNTNNNVTPSEDIINNIFSNDASGVKVTLTDKTTAVKLSATPVEDKALASSVLEKLNLPADNQIRILDLKLLDKDNHVVNSNAKRTVAIVLKEDEKDVAIYHIKDNGELKLIDSTTKDGVVTFEIDHFSKFAIVSNKSKQTSSNINNSKSGKHLAKTGLSNNNLASLAAMGLVLSGALILGRSYAILSSIAFFLFFRFIYYLNINITLV